MSRYLVHAHVSFIADSFSEEDLDSEVRVALESFLTDNELIQSELPEIESVEINKIAR